MQRTDIEQGSLESALRWANRLSSSPGSNGGATQAAEVQVLHLARDPDEMYADASRPWDQLERHAGSLSARVLQCIRFGASPERRVARWITGLGADLLILRRSAAEAASVAQDEGWFRLLAVASCPVLVLPPHEGENGPALVANRQLPKEADRPSARGSNPPGGRHSSGVYVPHGGIAS